MGPAKIPELRPALLLLAALESAKRAVDMRELCEQAGLSRSAGERAFRILRSRSLVERSSRGFGQSILVSLTGPGKLAAASASLLLQLLGGDSNMEALRPGTEESAQLGGHEGVHGRTV